MYVNIMFIKFYYIAELRNIINKIQQALFLFLRELKATLHHSYYLLLE